MSCVDFDDCVLGLASGQRITEIQIQLSQVTWSGGSRITHLVG
jgi:hypothetical protein